MQSDVAYVKYNYSCIYLLLIIVVFIILLFVCYTFIPKYMQLQTYSALVAHIFRLYLYGLTAM